MESLATNHDRCRTLAENSVHEVRTKYTWDAKAGQMLDFYEKLVPGVLDRSGSEASNQENVDVVLAEVDGALREETIAS